VKKQRTQPAADDQAKGFLMSGPSELQGPDLRKEGIAAAELKDGEMLVGHADEEAVLLAKRGGEIFAVGATCTHYGGPLAEGLMHGDTVRCPWHHACFSLRNGEALHAPALNPIACWKVEKRGDRLFVTGKSEPSPAAAATAKVASVVIIGGGAAAQAAAEMLRRRGYGGKLTMLSRDASPPCDRPNLSKDYLAGNAPEEWIPLRPPEFFADQHIDLVLDARVSAIDVAKKGVTVEGGRTYGYDALLLATGADPVKLDIPGSDLPHVHYLRTLGDSRAIIAKLADVKRAVVLGASFIGLEVAASLRARDVEVHVVAPEARPLEHVLGPQLGEFLRGLHEEHGVVFHLGQTAKSIAAKSVTLANGDVVVADLVVAGIGVRPAVALAEKAGLTLDRGVAVDAFLQTSVPGIFAAGDIARWPDPHTGEKIRVEHWVVAERQGQIAARNILGLKEACTLAPFFWSQHYDVAISYVGHAEKWDRIDVDGSIAARDCTLTYRRGDKTLAVVTLGRDVESLRAEAAMEDRVQKRR
jgi:NADPH-dependent 2,4-dienoyl-CoA reductase/sulfur reductase-like enzyme/nitrite reductase/ring-hydroxylating ferredoxin subunit